MPLDASEKIDLLLEEYKALRAEMLARMGHRAGLFGLLGAGAAVAVAGSAPIALKVSLAAILLTVALGYWTWTHRIVHRIGDRGCELEKTINAVAAGAEAPRELLTWETRYSPGADKRSNQGRCVLRRSICVRLRRNDLPCDDGR